MAYLAKNPMKFGHIPIRLVRNASEQTRLSYRNRNFVYSTREVNQLAITSPRPSHPAGIRDLNINPARLPVWAPANTYTLDITIDDTTDFENEFFKWDSTNRIGTVKAPFGFLTPAPGAFTIEWVGAAAPAVIATPPLGMLVEDTFEIAAGDPNLGSGDLKVTLDVLKADSYITYRSDSLAFPAVSAIKVKETPNGHYGNDNLSNGRATFEEKNHKLEDYPYAQVTADKPQDLTYYYKVVGTYGGNVPTVAQIDTYPVFTVKSAEETLLALTPYRIMTSGVAVFRTVAVPANSTVVLDIRQEFNRPAVEVKVQALGENLTLTLNNVNNESIVVEKDTTQEFPSDLMVLRLIMENKTGTPIEAEVTGMVPIP